MNCQAIQDWMARDFQAFLSDPAAQAHVATCPGCRAVLADEHLVRSALAAYAFPQVDEALLARLRAIPDRYPKTEARAATAEPLDLPPESWPRRSARWLGRWR